MSKTVSITANDDGSFTVETEPTQEAATDMEPGAENAAPDMAEDKAEGEPGQQVGSLREALSAAAQMLGGGPDKPMMDGEAEFMQGFKGVRGTPDEQYAARQMR